MCVYIIYFLLFCSQLMLEYLSCFDLLLKWSTHSIRPLSLHYVIIPPYLWLLCIYLESLKPQMSRIFNNTRLLIENDWYLKYVND